MPRPAGTAASAASAASVRGPGSTRQEMSSWHFTP